MFRRLVATAVVLCAAACAKQANRATEPTPSPTPVGNYKAEATDWALRSIGADGRTISIQYTMSGVASGCQRRGATTADESADKVVVTTHKLVLQDRNRPCTEELGYIDAVVVLNSPLRARALVGCRPPRNDVSEDSVCRDRGRAQGFAPQPSPAG
jgi:hypothetical protein